MNLKFRKFLLEAPLASGVGKCSDPHADTSMLEGDIDHAQRVAPR